VTAALPVAANDAEVVHGDIFILDFSERDNDDVVPLAEIINSPEYVEAVAASQPSPAVRTLRAVARALRHFIRAVGDAVVAFARALPRGVATYGERRRRMSYRGRHHTQRAWYGQERSTAQQVQRVNRSRAPRAVKEDDLPDRSDDRYWQEEDTFVGWLGVVLETMHREHVTLHAPTHSVNTGGRQFICS
jgi:hypothetical protein